VAERKPFLLRIDSGVLDAVQRWANDDLRSLNAQIEWIATTAKTLKHNPFARFAIFAFFAVEASTYRSIQICR
jgi:hypothetical protein